MDKRYRVVVEVTWIEDQPDEHGMPVEHLVSKKDVMYDRYNQYNIDDAVNSEVLSEMEQDILDFECEVDGCVPLEGETFCENCGRTIEPEDIDPSDLYKAKREEEMPF